MPDTENAVCMYMYVCMYIRMYACMRMHAGHRKRRGKQKLWGETEKTRKISHPFLVTYKVLSY